MKNILTTFIFFISLTVAPSFASETLYKNLQLEGKLNLAAFEYAVQGFDKIKNKKNDAIITIIDYSLSSARERLFVIDLKSQRILYQTLVSHGEKSGGSYANSFSNVNNSHKSSLGFFVTGETYYGKHGYSLRLDGLEDGINDNARDRAIVIHGAWYVSDDFVEKHGRLGRSWGCPALPKELSKEIIDLIRNGTYIFIYGDNKEYVKKSKFIG